MSDSIRTEPSDLAPTDEAGDDMHIHKPKPLHGLREIATEIGVIVIGIVIALCAEQVVERLHEAQLARETLVTARAELRSALEDHLNRRATQDCINSRLDEITRLLAASDQPGYKPPSWIGRPQIWGFNTSGWDAAAQGGRVALLSEQNQAELGSLYSQLRDLDHLQRDEQRAWADLRQLEDQPHVDPQMRESVRSALQQARLLNWNVRVDLEQSAAQAEKLGIMIGPHRPKGSPSVCLPTDTPRAEAIARVNAFFADKLGEP